MRTNSKSGLTRLPFSVIELNQNVHVAKKKLKTMKERVLKSFLFLSMAVYSSLRSQFLKASQFVVYLLAYLADWYLVPSIVVG